jgi:hypothetical protein
MHRPPPPPNHIGFFILELYSLQSTHTSCSLAHKINEKKEIYRKKNRQNTIEVKRRRER